MTTTYYARVDYTYAGGSKLFTIPFSYLKESHIKVYIDDTETTDFTFNTTSQIQVNATLETGDVVSIRRSTPIDNRMITFTNTSILNKDNQNTSAQQTFNMVQEIYDNNTTFEIKVVGDIDDIQDEVDTANATANSALTNANTAITTANTASSNASSAVNTANTASANASSAVSTANTASANATSAVTTANTASATANAASDKVDEFGEDIEEVIEAAQKINELEEAVATAVAAASSASTSASTATTKATEASTAAATATTQAEEAKAKVGNLADLTTDAKTTTVAAINEVDGHCDTNATNIATINTELPHKLNDKQITNCILEDPQNIKLELNNGTLTLKAGSVVCVPNGFESDGTTPKFDEVTVESDLTTTGYQSDKIFILYQVSPASITTIDIAHTGSGTNPSSVSGVYYNTTTNIVQITTGGSETFAFPIAIADRTTGTITSINQTFQSIGYIGSTWFIRKGLKVLMPNGRNVDGSLKNVEHTTDKVLVETIADNSLTVNDAVLMIDNVFESGLAIISFDDSRTVPESGFSFNYNQKLNKIWDFTGAVKPRVFLGKTDVASGVISKFLPYTATNVLKYSDKSQISTWSLPSTSKINMTVGATWASYTAPANGWMYAIGSTYGSILLRNFTKAISNSSNCPASVGPFDGMCFVPVERGDTVQLAYNSGVQLCFIYAKGEI